MVGKGDRMEYADGSAASSRAPRTFRAKFYVCLQRRADALFEPTDAILTAGSVPSPPRLSLAAVHRRGWGNLYAVLSKAGSTPRRSRR